MFRVLLILGLGVLGNCAQTEWARAQLTEPCGRESLYQALLEHDKTQFDFEYKMHTGFMPGARGEPVTKYSKRAFLESGPRATLEAIKRNLFFLDGGAHRKRSL